MNGRIYDPQIGRFLSADAVIDCSLSLQGYNRYTYVHNNPLKFTDPSGYYIEANKTTGNSNELKATINKLATDAANAGLEGREIVSYVADHISQGRYVSTKDSGVIDMKHFLTATAEKDKFLQPEGLVRGLGIIVEERQAEVGNASAFGPEDLPSNEAGLDFQDKLDKEDIQASLGDQVVTFVNDSLGGTTNPPSSDQISELNTIRNLSGKPIMSPSDSDIVADPATGIRYKSSGDPKYDREQLDTMAANGISGNNVGNFKPPNGVEPSDAVNYVPEDQEKNN